LKEWVYIYIYPLHVRGETKMKARYNYKEIEKPKISKLCCICKFSDYWYNYSDSPGMYRWWCENRLHHKRRKKNFKIKPLGSCDLFEIKEMFEE